MAGNSSIRDNETAIDSESRRSSETLKTLVEAGAELSSTLDLRTLHLRLFRVVSEALPCNGFIISAYDPEVELIRCEFIWTDGRELDASLLPAIKFNPDVGMQSRVIAEERTLVFDDVNRKIQEPGGEYYDVNSSGEVRKIDGNKVDSQSALMVPIKLDGKVVGVVQVMSNQLAAYSREDVQLLEGLVHQLAIAAQNARLFERSLHEIAQREIAEKRVFQLLDSMPQMAFALTATGKVDYLNRPLMDYLGVKKNDQVSQPWSWRAWVHEDEFSRCEQTFRRCMGRGEVWEEEVRLRSRDAGFRWHLARMAPVLRADGEIDRWFGTATDIHELKEAQSLLATVNEELERRVEDRTAELKAAVRELEGFTYSVSHDLRAPLRAISATSSILLADAEGLKPEMQDLLRRQAAAAKKLGTLIDELLSLSRISRLTPSMSRVDVTEIATELWGELVSRETEKATVEIQPGLELYGDAQLLRLALMNLLENAVKFSPEGGKIVVGSRCPGSVFVEDHGIGFDMTHSKKMWHPFERLVRDDEFPGTGIGLANVRRIVERHHGTIEAESELGVGSVFTMRLPVPAEQEPG